jgi:hypothetical protein
MSSYKLDTDVKRARWLAAQDIEVHWEEILDPETHECLLNCALSTGTPIDFFVMPLLTTAASLMNDACMVANKKTEWREPSIIWTIISAPAGEHKYFV